jgi:hypothetical protein
MDYIRQVEASADFIYYYGNSYEPYSIVMNTFMLLGITGQFIWNMAGPEYLMYKAGELKGIPLSKVGIPLAAKWCNSVAWNMTLLYGWVENLAFSTLSATGNTLISSGIMVIYLLVKGENATGPDFEDKLSDGNYKLTLVDGTFFHYF